MDVKHCRVSKCVGRDCKIDFLSIVIKKQPLPVNSVSCISLIYKWPSNKGSDKLYYNSNTELKPCTV